MFDSNKGDGQEFNKMNILAGLFLGDIWGIAQLFAGLYLWFIGWTITFWELLLRWGHGSRHISSMRLILSFIVLNIAIPFGSLLVLLLQLGNYTQTGSLLGLVNLLFISLAIFHRVAANRRLHRGAMPGVEQNNSIFFGYSHLFRLSPYMKQLQRSRFVYRWAEPGLCFLLACLIYQLDPGTGLWALFCSSGLFLSNNISIQRMAYQIQDVIDAQTEGEYVMNYAGEPKQSEKKSGFVVRSSSAEEEMEDLPWYKPPSKEHAPAAEDIPLKEHDLVKEE